MTLGNIPDEDLRNLAVSILIELQRREPLRLMNNLRDGVLVLYSQDTRNGTIIRREDGTPIDREGWLYLPFLSDASHLFQPSRCANGLSHYQGVFRKGDVFLMTNRDGTTTRVQVGSQNQKIRVTDAQVLGQLSKR